jgi:hypothetical protein
MNIAMNSRLNFVGYWETRAEQVLYRMAGLAKEVLCDDEH